MPPAADLRFVQLGVLALRLHRLDDSAIVEELERRRDQAPELLGEATLVLDLEPLAGSADADDLVRLCQTLTDRDFTVLGLTGQAGERHLSDQTGLPALRLASPASQRRGEGAGDNGHSSAPRAATRFVDGPIRSGQQIYARAGDLVVTGSVSAGAEIVADGSIHVYGALRGRALAGALGEASARVHCLDFHAELVSVAGVYKVFEELPESLRGTRVCARLANDTLHLTSL